MIIWAPKQECMPRREIEELQVRRLQATLVRVYESVPFYRRKLDETGVKPRDIKLLRDLRNVPFTTKTDLRSNYPFGMLAVPPEEVVRIHASSGTTGDPTVVAYTRNDIETWAEVVARVITAAGVTKADVLQVAFGYGLFTGAFGLHYGAERVGAAVVPASSGGSERQVKLMKDFRTTAVACTPSYALHLAEVMVGMGLSPDDLALRFGLFGAEPWSEGVRRELEARLHISATDNYGLSEVIGPGVSGECPEKEGLHIFEDHFIAEIINPETCEPLGYGETGELVLTTITKEALPVLRYRTRDICHLDDAPCKCGRTHVRMSRVSGRTDDMLIIRGVNVFPSQVETVLLEMEGTEPHYQLVISKKGALDELEVRVEVSEGIFFDEMKKLEELREGIRRRLTSVLGLSPKVTLVEPKTIERSTGKAKRVLDMRR